MLTRSLAHSLTRSFAVRSPGATLLRTYMGVSEEDDEPLDQGIPFPFPFPLPFGNLNPEVLFGAGGGPIALPFPAEILNTVLGGGPPLGLGNGMQLEDPAGGVVLQCSIM